ncbi:MAG: 50S ribosomal protein L21 [Candidatus Levybacteria bacterium]|nr:50S ribosomal protein L21 [Candidatus Levybacteria bacterium]
MEYVVIKTGGKQYRVSLGDQIEIESLSLKPDEEYVFNEVLLYVSDGVVKIGKPNLSGVKVVGKVLEEKKGIKIRVSKFKSKVRYRRVTGHRQLLTKILIKEIEEEKKKEEKKTLKKENKK